jgi:hypothetical protein
MDITSNTFISAERLSKRTVWWRIVFAFLMNFWSDILDRSCQGSKIVLYILYYNMLHFILYICVVDMVVLLQSLVAVFRPTQHISLLSQTHCMGDVFQL